eukprot:SAG11_NODE_5825_length_1455_cov_1.323746_1_plen_52_part_10
MDARASRVVEKENARPAWHYSWAPRRLPVVTVLIRTSCALLHHTAPPWFHRA